MTLFLFIINNFFYTYQDCRKGTTNYDNGNLNRNKTVFMYTFVLLFNI